MANKHWSEQPPRFPVSASGVLGRLGCRTEASPGGCRSAFGITMKNRLAIAAIGCSIIAALFVGLGISTSRDHDPADLSHWTLVASSRDWSMAATQGDPQGQYLYGLSLIRTNISTMVSEVPRLSALPIIGARFFKRTAYDIDRAVNQETLAEAYRWVKRSADQGYHPAKETEKILVRRIALPNQSGQAGGKARRSQMPP